MMKNRQSMLSLLATLTLMSVSSLKVWGDTEVFRNELSDSAGWSLVADDIDDTKAVFGFDYSDLGIPEAPNSREGDTGTSGLQVFVNLVDGKANALAAIPTGMSFSGKYVYQFDMWINAPGPFPEGGSGSTQTGGGSIGFVNDTTNPLSGAGFNVTGEGGTGTDYRFYAHDELQAFATHIDPDTNVNDLYDEKMVYFDEASCLVPGECGGGNADGNTYLESAFPGLQAPEKQQTDYPLVQIGTTKDGAAAFQWMTVKFTVDTDAGTAFVQMTSDTSGNTVDIGTFTLNNTYVDRDTIDTKLVTTMEGNISLLYRDPFDSLVLFDDIPVTFGLFDNVMVTQIEDVVELPGDYNKNGTVDAADYTTWKDNFGQSAQSANSLASVPEPASMLVATIGILLIGALRHRMYLRSGSKCVFYGERLASRGCGQMISLSEYARSATRVNCIDLALCDARVAPDAPSVQL
ncbi:MAG: PEP-CTERM sorting domain-containing protein [Pirellulaceae bacterium]|nr:PEP-CTERM sorting domain-containing protein [Planctomycetales bacterium]